MAPHKFVTSKNSTLFVFRGIKYVGLDKKWGQLEFSEKRKQLANLGGKIQFSRISAPWNIQLKDPKS